MRLSFMKNVCFPLDDASGYDFNMLQNGLARSEQKQMGWIDVACGDYGGREWDAVLAFESEDVA
ncbi:hypothetical protein Pan54_35200 [Rubinisphaera italica]|uniref:Uncharacterized protein n=1 Tax=Rubinisphaera italica TaxID=2527969 RepID=A0A5C5XKW0_9PLAN|nr:hypothetical protein Pan54_35200 [Rubinisphaera italica]